MADVIYSGSAVLPLDAEVTASRRGTIGLSRFGGSANALRGISVGGATSTDGDCPGGRHYQPYATQSLVEGSPGIPSLQLNCGYWRFRWVVQSGSRTISVKAKQSSSYVGDPRPTLIVRKNPTIGIPNDVGGSASLSADWVTIGPVNVTASMAGVVWVEMRNETTASFLEPAYFDHIVVT